jgi:uncharacterized protein YdaU (DUF1376 family)
MAKFEEKIAEWMPLRLQIWHRGTAFLSPAERGAYMDLILAYWELGPLPNEDSVLQQLARVNDTKVWRRVRTKVLAKFTVIDGALTHARIDEERTVALQKFKQKAYAGRVGGKASAQAKAKQPSTSASTTVERVLEANTQAEPQAEPQAKSNTTYQEHSPSGETEANASVATKPRKARRTRLADDWKPSEDDHAHAVSEGLTDAEIAADLAEWREYWRGPEPRDPLKANWSATYRKHVTKWAPGIIAGRARSQRPAGNSRRDQSVTAATDSILAKAGLRRAGGAGPVSTHDLSDGVGNQSGADDSGAVVDAVEWRRVSESSEGIEGSDTPDPGDDGRSGIAACGVPEAADGLPGRRGAACPDDTSEIQPVVACVAGSSREIGTAYLSAPQDAGGAEGYADIPAFLDRRHEFDRSGH